MSTTMARMAVQWIGALGLVLGWACGARSGLDAPIVDVPIGGGGRGGSMPPLGGASGCGGNGPTIENCANLPPGDGWWQPTEPSDGSDANGNGCGCWVSESTETYGAIGLETCTRDGTCECYRNGVYVMTCTDPADQNCDLVGFGCCSAVVPFL
jgi:hypothetical protein